MATGALQKRILETKLAPFIPGFIPCVGDIDPFIHIPRPDGTRGLNGLECLNEPSGSQSDPAALHLKLRFAIIFTAVHQRQVVVVRRAHSFSVSILVVGARKDGEFTLSSPFDLQSLAKEHFL